MSGGHGAKLDRRKEVALAALLAAPTIAEAAKIAGVGHSTLRRWLGDPAFAAAYRAARRELLGVAIARLAALCAVATETLERAMACGTAAVEVRAAVAVLGHAYRG